MNAEGRIALRAPRILFPFIGGDQIGGSHVSALKLIARLPERGFDPVIVLHHQGGTLGRMVTDLGLTPFVLTDVAMMAPAYSRRAGDASAWRFATRSLPRLVRFLRQEKIDLLHTNDGRMHGSWAFAARLAGVPQIWHHRQSPRAAGINYLAPLMARRIVSVSHFSRPARPIGGIDHKFRVIRSPFDFVTPRPDPAQCHARLCAELGVPDQTILLGYVGELNDRKRPDHFIRTLAACRDALPNRRVCGLLFGKADPGAGKIIERCQIIANELNLGDNLCFMGQYTPIEPAMAGLDALFITALDEPFGRTLIEAMYLGVPVIATNHGGNPEAICDGETGFLVDHGDPSAFVAPLRRLLTDTPLRDRITRKAQSETTTHYGTDIHVKQITALYHEVLAETARRR